MAIVTVGVIVNLPKPLFVAALKNFTGVGAVAPAGTPTGYVMPFTGFVQWPPPLIHATAGTALMLEALVDNWLLTLVPVNVVEVIVRFQPAEFPLASVTASPSA